ncbi:capsular biosynthesis protein, partial [Bacteroides cellulosilyticus]
HLLVETSYFNPPMGLNNILLRIKAKGYYPLLAHPERYIYMGESDYQRLKDMGVKFQLNLPSLVGIYGKSVQKKAKQLLKHTMYDMVGSDLHTLTQCSLFNEHCMSSLVTVRLK